MAALLLSTVKLAGGDISGVVVAVDQPLHPFSNRRFVPPRQRASIERDPPTGLTGHILTFKPSISKMAVFRQQVLRQRRVESTESLQPDLCLKCNTVYNS
jgi:hypothetical protein